MSSKTNEGHINLSNVLLTRASTALKFSSLCRGHLLEGDLASSGANMND